PPPAAVVHRCALRIPGRRRDPRRRDGRPASAPARRPAPHRPRCADVRARRRRAARPAARGDRARGKRRRRRCRLGGRRARDGVPAAQPERAARARVRRREHAAERPADDLDRARRAARDADRLPARDRDHDGGDARLCGLPPHALPRGGRRGRARARGGRRLDRAREERRRRLRRGRSGNLSRPLRKNRDFNILWSGQLVSTIGSEVSGLAFPLLVLALTHSPARAGIVGFANALPNIFFYLPAGALVDRWNRKRIMLAADAARAVALGTIAVSLWAHELTFVQIVLVAFVEGSFGVFFRVSESAALPQVVPREQLPQAIAQNQARQQGAGVVSQPLGGFVFAVGRSVPFVFDALSYAASFVSLLFVRPAFQEAREPAAQHLRAEIAE